MNKLIKILIKQRKVTILLSIFALAYGFYSYYYMPRQENPDLASPGVLVTTIFPGASAEVVEEQITSKIEDKIAELNGVDHIKSYSQENASIVVGFLKTDVDYDKEWEKLRISIDDLKREFPESVLSPKIDTDLTETAGIIISLSSSEYDTNRLADFAEDYKDKLLKLDGIKKVNLNGIRKSMVEITIDNKKVDALSISTSDIFNLIRAQNVVIPAGSIKTEEGKINVNIPVSFKNIEDFKNMVVNISPLSGAMVRLKDVADVKISEKETDTYYIKNGKPSILITAYFEGEKNVVLIGEKVRKEIDKLSKLYPESLNIDEVLFLPQDVKESVNSFILNLFEGILLVIVIIFFGMGIRNAIVVSLAIPLSIAISFIYMSIFKMELQQVSISALIIALGMLVDNAIVISDAIQTHINQGKTKALAAYLGAKEQALPVFSSTLTTIAAFSPLMILPGSAGDFVASLPLIVIVSLSASFAVAMFVSPALASLSLKERNKVFDPLKPIQKIYTKLMNFNISKPIISLGLVIVLLCGAVWLALTQISIKMFPYVDKNWVYINIDNEVIGDIESTEKLILKADEILKSYEEITETIDSIGGDLPRYYMMADHVMPSENKGMILASFDLSKTDRFKKREDFVYDLQKKLDAEFVGGYATSRLLEINIPGPNIEVRLSGSSLEDIEDTAENLYHWILDRQETMNVQKIKPSYKYRYEIDIDDDKAISLGLNKYEIQHQINLALNGMKAASMSSSSKSFDIYMKSDIKNIEELGNLLIKSSITGNKIALKSFADIKILKSIDQIYRYNRQPVISVSADVKPGYGSIQKEIEEYIASLDTSNLTINYGGDQQTTDIYLSGLYSAAIIALAAIYLILLVQFNSITQPFIILITVPLALIGVVLALLITRTNFTFTVGLGAASLMGIVVNNGILLIEYINRARKEGQPLKDACVSSVNRRVRPILLSSLTTIFGLIPLALGDSAYFTPMAIALIGGLITATFMTITIIPTIYYVMHLKDKSFHAVIEGMEELENYRD